MPIWLVYFLLTYFTIQLIFATIHGSHCTISTNIYLYLQYFQQKVFRFSKLSEFQTDPVTVCFKLNPAFTQVHVFPFFFFSCAWTVTSHGFTVQETKITIHALFITVHALKNIKIRSHGIIHTFKNYFVTVLSVFSFQFSNNKLNPNGPPIIIPK